MIRNHVQEAKLRYIRYGIFAIGAVYWPIHRRLGGRQKCKLPGTRVSTSTTFAVPDTSSRLLSGYFKTYSPFTPLLESHSLAHHECLQGGVSKNL